MKLSHWIEAMRLRTLPVSAAGVVTASALGVVYKCLHWLPAMLCLVFALLAQIASNFANEYYDYQAGLDRPGRVGPRRGVTEGDITPRAMKIATFATLAVASIIGLSLIYWGGWWLIFAGLFIGAGALAYSAGPYPLSRHALGEVAVILFFGVVPVNLTFYLFSNTFAWPIFASSVAVGLMGANILLVNNYRDEKDDRAVGKNTIATKFGAPAALYLYLIFGVAAVLLFIPIFIKAPLLISASAFYLTIHILLFAQLRVRKGKALNPLLGMTAMNMLIFALLTLILSLIK